MIKKILAGGLRKAANLLDPSKERASAFVFGVREKVKDKISVAFIPIGDGKMLHLKNPAIFDVQTDGREWMASTTEFGFGFRAYSDTREGLDSSVAEELDGLVKELWTQISWWDEARDHRDRKLMRSRLQGIMQEAH